MKSSITLIKGQENSVKAMYDSEGSIRWIRDKSDLVGYLHKK